MRGGEPTSEARQRLAVLSADVVGYSRLMAMDEAATFRCLQDAINVARAMTAMAGGWITEAAGDSFLAVFPTVAGAVEFARRFQDRRFAERPHAVLGRPFRFRIGIHHGEVHFHGGRGFGRTVLAAIRLQERAPPGGVCVSADLLRDGDLPAGLQAVSLDMALRPREHGHDIGTFLLGRRRPSGNAAMPRTWSGIAPVGAMVDAPRIALRPFEAVGCDRGSDAALGSGLALELSCRLCRFRELAVVGAGAGPDYAVTGTLLRSGQTMVVKLCLQAADGRLLWSDRRQQPAAALAADLGACSEGLAARLVPALRRLIAADGGAPETAYRLVMRGHLLCDSSEQAAVREARSLFRRARRLAPGAARPLSGLARTHLLTWLFGWSEQPERVLARGARLAQTAVDRDPNDARSWSELGRAQLYRDRADAALAAYERAVDLNPCDTDILADYATALDRSGRPAAALTIIARAQRLGLPRFDPIYDPAHAALRLLQAARGQDRPRMAPASTWAAVPADDLRLAALPA